MPLLGIEQQHIVGELYRKSNYSTGFNYTAGRKCNGYDVSND